MTVITMFDAQEVITAAQPIARDRVVGPHVLLRHPNSILAAAVIGTTTDEALKLWVINGAWHALLWADGTFQPLTGEGANNYPVEVIWQGVRPFAADDSDALLIAIAREIVRGDIGANRQDTTNVAMPIGLMRASMDALMEAGQDTLAARIVDAGKGVLPAPKTPTTHPIVLTPAQLARVCTIMAQGLALDVRTHLLEGVAGPLVAESLRHNVPGALGSYGMTGRSWETVAAVLASGMETAHKREAILAVAGAEIADHLIPMAS